VAELSAKKAPRTIWRHLADMSVSSLLGKRQSQKLLGLSGEAQVLPAYSIHRHSVAPLEETRRAAARFKAGERASGYRN
jgi:hypothetical protein